MIHFKIEKFSMDLPEVEVKELELYDSIAGKSAAEYLNERLIERLRPNQYLIRKDNYFVIIDNNECVKISLEK